MKTYTEQDLINTLRNRRDGESQKDAAARLGFSAQFINDVLQGRRSITNDLALAMGFIRTPTSYIRKRETV